MISEKCKKINNEKQSFPSIYRELIKDLEPDLAIKIINELKKKILSAKKKKLTTQLRQLLQFIKKILLKDLVKMQ